MDEKAKKTVLRMIPYGLYVLTAADEDDNIAAAGINWLMQASFRPPLVAVGVKVDSLIHPIDFGFDGVCGQRAREGAGGGSRLRFSSHPSEKAR